VTAIGTQEAALIIIDAALVSLTRSKLVDSGVVADTLLDIRTIVAAFDTDATETLNLN
jgi:hypothetical protein